MRSKLITKSLFNKANYWLSLTLVLGVMTVIFWLSAQDDSHSARQSGGFLDVFINIFIPSYKTMTASARENLYGILHTVIRKIGHFSEYLVLGAALTLHTKAICKNLNKRFSIWAPFVFGVLYAASDELHQYFVPGRAMRFYDVCIDASGVFCGICIVLLIYRITNRARKTKPKQSKQA